MSYIWKLSKQSKMSILHLTAVATLRLEWKFLKWEALGLIRSDSGHTHICHICYCDHLIALAKSSDLPHVVLLLTHLAFIPTTWHLPLCHMGFSNLPQVVVFNICHIWFCHIIAVPATGSPLTCHMWSSYLPHDVFFCVTFRLLTCHKRSSHTTCSFFASHIWLAKKLHVVCDIRP